MVIMFKFNLKEIWLHLTGKNGPHPRLQNYSRQQEKLHNLNLALPLDMVLSSPTAQLLAAIKMEL